jgi:hypothetical protein
MGAAVGDIDGDGRDDLLVTGWRDLRLYRNLGNFRFEDVTDASGLARDGWSTCAAFADLDDDGDLDLYVGRYLDYDPTTAPFCAAPDGKRDYCGPEVFPAQSDRLYLNDGQGRFEDVSARSGLDAPGGRALGVLVADLSGDGRLDLFVANDGTACRLWENRGDGTFRDVADAAGLALDASGTPLAGMGVALGDVDGDGHADLVVANFLGRSTVGFRNLGPGLFADASSALGLKAATRAVLGFGVALQDFDADGDLDLIQSDGHVLDRARLGEPLAMPTTLLRNDAGRFVDASERAGPAFPIPRIGRGLAVGDLDRDGRPDVALASLDCPLALLRSTSPGRSCALVPEGLAPGSALGATLRVRVNGRLVERVLPAGGSYLSAHARAVYVPVGDARAIDRVDVTWRSGRTDSWVDLPIEPELRLRERPSPHPARSP